MASLKAFDSRQDDSQAEQANLVEQDPIDMKLELRRLQKAHHSLKRWMSGLVLLFLLTMMILVAAQAGISSRLLPTSSAQPTCELSAPQHMDVPAKS